MVKAKRKWSLVNTEKDAMSVCFEGVQEGPNRRGKALFFVVAFKGNLILRLRPGSLEIVKR